MDDQVFVDSKHNLQHLMYLLLEKDTPDWFNGPAAKCTKFYYVKLLLSDKKMMMMMMIMIAIITLALTTGLNRSNSHDNNINIRKGSSTCRSCITALTIIAV